MVMPWLPWVIALVALLVLVAAATGAGATLADRLRGGRGRSVPPRRVANSAALLSSPVLRDRLRRRRVLHAGLGAALVVALAAAAMLAGRPVERSVRNESLASRDIVLCLDISTSMVTTDSKILDTFTELLDTFEGERVALVAWNSTAQTIVPLTDDYELLREQFNEIADVLDFLPVRGNPALERYYATFPGTLSDDVDGSSLAGDGLASCTLAFDHQVEDRSRSIILATDNQILDPFDEQIYSVSEAADLAQEESIRLFSLFGADPELADPDVSGKDVDEAREDLREITTSHDGRFYEVDDADTAGQIVQELEADQLDELAGNTQVRTTDIPERAAAWLAVVVLALLAVTAWRRA
ncbi:VWA domain-containing protein [Actinomyces sp. MRS3W]|uniref:VWA domain-containing protein n=1 Tax=Actinomyces sp. MRS3W TaxID=2800796 RepID=UPI0028FD5EB5|nr:VWA domain-containing protein [Actinomyces sp. MRS3W]MDU0348827.1 VWA domain-containing protein [Actinomyces sp. MRS3W]